MALKCLAQCHGVTMVLPQEQHKALSAKERRKERNERRVDLAVSIKEKMEQMDEAFAVAPTRKKTVPAPNVAKLANLGMQWYALKVVKGRELIAAEAMRSALREMFPSMEFEIICPVVPAKRRFAGKLVDCRKALVDAHIFLHCVLEASVYRAIKDETSVYSFAGFSHRYRTGDPSIRVPTPVPRFQIKALCAEAEKLEREHAALAAVDVKTQEQQALQAVEPEADVVISEEQGGKDTTEAAGVTYVEHKAAQSGGGMNTGDPVFIASGPYQSFQGTIKEFLPDGQVRVALVVFGSETEIEIHSSELQLE